MPIRRLACDLRDLSPDLVGVQGAVDPGRYSPLGRCRSLAAAPEEDGVHRRGGGQLLLSGSQPDAGATGLRPGASDLRLIHWKANANSGLETPARVVFRLLQQELGAPPERIKVRGGKVRLPAHA
jgi:hypothetical protein